jgi:hypothetical protein
MTLTKFLAAAAVAGTVLSAAPVAMAHETGGAQQAPYPYYAPAPYYNRGGSSDFFDDGSFFGDTRGSGRGRGSGEGEFNMNFSGKGRGDMDANTDFDGSGYGGSQNYGGPYGGGYGAPQGAPYGYGAPRRMAPPQAPAPAKK